MLSARSHERRRERHALLRQRTQTRLVAGIFVILATVALIELRPLLIPVAVAALLTILLHPAVHLLSNRLRLPLTASAGLVLVLLLTLILAAGFGLAPSVLLWMEKLPGQLRSAELELRDLTRPVEEFRELTEKLESLAGLKEDGAETVVATDGNLAAAVLARTQGFVVSSALTVGLLFFFLAFGDAFLRRIVHALPRRSSRFHALTVIDSVRRDVGQYIATVSIINLGLGLVVSLVLWLLGMPNALLWGAMAAVFNYVPYIGAVVGVIVISLVALATYNDIAPALGVGACYYALTAIEGTFVTPSILGRRMRVSPIVVFAGILFWGWIWGVAGAVLAVPLLVGMKIAADHVRSLQGLALAIGTEEPEDEGAAGSRASASTAGEPGEASNAERPGKDA